MKRLLCGLATAGLIAISGCGTIGSLGEQPKIYGGLRNDIDAMARGVGPCDPGCFMAIDLPLSLALDTVVLPFTVIYEIFISR